MLHNLQASVEKVEESIHLLGSMHLWIQLRYDGAIAQKPSTKLSFSSQAALERSTADRLGSPPSKRLSAIGDPVGNRPSRSTMDNTQGTSITLARPLRSMMFALADTRACPTCTP